MLFPLSITYYEKEIEELIETEQYEKVFHLVTWLRSQPHLSHSHITELQALYDWLRHIFEDQPRIDESILEDKLGDERKFLVDAVKAKSHHQPHYVEQLFELLDSGSIQQQVQALEQLTHTDDSTVNLKLKAWLEQDIPNPFIQFKGLQTLKIRLHQGEIELKRRDQVIGVRIEDTPLDLYQFPSVFLQVLENLKAITDSDYPDFLFFAEQTWHDFLIFHYGTQTYRDLEKMGNMHVNIWAAALHTVLFESLYEDVDVIHIWETYQINEEQQTTWRETYAYLRKFVSVPLK